jgi:hypothetical protein
LVEVALSEGSYCSGNQMFMFTNALPLSYKDISSQYYIALPHYV